MRLAQYSPPHRAIVPADANQRATWCAGVSCGVAPTPPHSKPTKSIDPDGQEGEPCSGEQRYQTKCLASCDQGYTGNPKHDVTFECGADGQWTGTLECPVVECSGDLDDWTVLVGRGTVPAECRDTDNQKTFSQTCEATCDEGYTRTTDGYVAYPEVTATFTCSMKDASDKSTTGTWFGRMPTDSGLCEGASRDVRCLRWLNIDPTQYRL